MAGGSLRMVHSDFRFHPIRLIVAGELLFAAMVAVCLLIKPSAEAMRGGLSFYGTHDDTAVPFLVGVIGCAALTAAAVSGSRSSVPWLPPFRRAVGIVLALMVAIPITPYSVDIVFDWLHIAISVVLFVAALLVGGWVALAVATSALARALWLLQFLTGVAAAAAQLGWIGLMIPSQLLFQFVFAGLVAIALGKAIESRPTRLRVLDGRSAESPMRLITTDARSWSESSFQVALESSSTHLKQGGQTDDRQHSGHQRRHRRNRTLR